MNLNENNFVNNFQFNFLKTFNAKFSYVVKYEILF